MTTISAKTAALSVMIAFGTLMSHSALAGILHTKDGAPITTRDGVPVVTEDGLDCAKAPVLDYVAPAKIDAERVVFFDFNKSTLSKASKAQLNKLVAKIKANKSQNIVVVGYADRMGSAAYNEKLALKRAKSVHDYLVNRGVKAKKMEVRSLGKSVSTTKCDAITVRADMISCLSGDRRVEIEIK